MYIHVPNEPTPPPLLYLPQKVNVSDVHVIEAGHHFNPRPTLINELLNHDFFMLVPGKNYDGQFARQKFHSKLSGAPHFTLPPGVTCGRLAKPFVEPNLNL